MNRRITSCRVTANRDCLQMTSSTVMARRTTRPYLKIPCLIPGCWDQNLKKRKWWRFIPVRTSELYIYFSVLCCPAALNTQIHAEYYSVNSLSYLLKWFVEIVDYFTVLITDSPDLFKNTIATTFFGEIKQNQTLLCLKCNPILTYCLLICCIKSILQLCWFSERKRTFLCDIAKLFLI